MAIMFMKIDTNCDGTVDWVSVSHPLPSLARRSLVLLLHSLLVHTG